MRRVLCFGDSNTHGTRPFRHRRQGLPRMGADERWPGVAAAALGPGWQLVEEGQPGRTTVHDDPVEGPHRNGLTVLPALVESHQPLDVLTIMLGTNDLKARFSVTAEDIALSLGRLVRRARAVAPGLPVLLICPPLPREAGCLRRMYAGAEARGAGLPDEIAAVAEAEGCAFLDANPHAVCDPADGVHFAPEGHAALGRAVAAALRGMHA